MPKKPKILLDQANNRLKLAAGAANPNRIERQFVMRTESFFLPFFSWPAVLAVTISLAPLAEAQSGRGSPALTYVPGSSVKLYQVNGDCDWAEWDATITNKTPTCKPTASRTATNADVLGDDVPVAFEQLPTSERRT
jgi:hypothetical protein